MGTPVTVHFFPSRLRCRESGGTGHRKSSRLALSEMMGEARSRRGASSTAFAAMLLFASVASGSTLNVAQNTVRPRLPQFGPESVVAAVEAVKAGKIIVVTDDESRENEGDLIMAAELATPETIGFFVRYSSGVICVAVRLPHASLPAQGLVVTPAGCTPQVEGSRLDELELPPMVANNEDPKETAFTVSVDVKVCRRRSAIASKGCAQSR